MGMHYSFTEAYVISILMITDDDIAVILYIENICVKFALLSVSNKVM